MHIGSGCTKHLGDMPEKGVYVCRVAKHYVAVVDGVMMDTFRDSLDCCVYGYWHKPTVVLRRSVSFDKWYITTTDAHGNILAWVEGTKFAVNGTPTSFSSYEAAVDKLKTLGKDKDPNWVVRRACVKVQWKDC